MFMCYERKQAMYHLITSHHLNVFIVVSANQCVGGRERERERERDREKPFSDDNVVLHLSVVWEHTNWWSAWWLHVCSCHCSLYIYIIVIACTTNPCIIIIIVIVYMITKGTVLAQYPLYYTYMYK